MKKGSIKPVRCAIYTRVSTDHGLEQDFNSLDAQHDAAQAYIRSQAHAGWTPIRSRYDDGGYSGGSTDRPALQRLLADVKAGKIDVIVVYKVDRLTRSLADFAKLVELFDGQGVSFVSVTQQFNTTTSMGRLTLNVLLSFAQFEREVTSERIRDKIAASKRKGLWVGGIVPLGYATRDRKIVVVEQEAERVRTIFRSYLEFGSLNRLMADLRARGIVTKARSLKAGRTIGGIPFTRGPLAHLLRNRFYIGEVAFKGEILPGEQSAIIDRDLFDAVQAKLTEQRNNHTVMRDTSEAMLIGRIYDDRGNRMSPSHVRKGRIKYRYYLSSPLLRDEALAEDLLSDVFLDVWRQSREVRGALVGFYLAIGDRALQGALGAAPQDRCGIRRGGRSNHSRSSRQSRARAAEKEPGRTGAPILGQALARARRGHRPCLLSRQIGQGGCRDCRSCRGHGQDAHVLCTQKTSGATRGGIERSMGLLSSTSSDRPATSIASSRARSRPTCRWPCGSSSLSTPEPRNPRTELPTF